MQNTESRTATRFDHHGAQTVHDTLVLEAPLHLRVNGEAFTTTMRTPGDDEALARGLLFTEGILRDGMAPLTFKSTPDPENDAVACLDIAVDPQHLSKPVAGRRSLLASASCGVCGTREPADINVYGDPIALRRSIAFDATAFGEFLTRMRANQTLFSETGGAHGAALFDDRGELLTVREDIGRHNAVDKAIGHALTIGHLDHAACLAVSGRVSYEIVYKTYRAGVPVLIAVGAASSMAVETSDRLGITLAAFCREGRATVYTHTERVAAVTAEHR